MRDQQELYVVSNVMQVCLIANMVGDSERLYDVFEWKVCDVYVCVIWHERGKNHATIHDLHPDYVWTEPYFAMAPSVEDVNKREVVFYNLVCKYYLYSAISLYQFFFNPPYGL